MRSIGALAGAMIGGLLLVAANPVLPLGVLLFGSILAMAVSPLNATFVLVAVGAIRSVALVRAVGALTTALTAVLFIRSEADIGALALLLVVPGAVNALGSMVLILRHEGHRRLSEGSMPTSLGAWYRRGFDYAKADVSILVYMSADRLILFVTAGVTVVGLYEAASRLIQPFYALSTVIRELMFLELAHAIGGDRLAPTVRRWARSMFVATIPVGPFLWLHGAWVIALVYGAGFEGATLSLMILGWAITIGFVSGAVVLPFLRRNSWPPVRERRPRRQHHECGRQRPPHTGARRGRCGTRHRRREGRGDGVRPSAIPSNLEFPDPGLLDEVPRRFHRGSDRQRGRLARLRRGTRFDPRLRVRLRNVRQRAGVVRTAGSPKVEVGSLRAEGWCETAVQVETPPQTIARVVIVASAFLVGLFRAVTGPTGDFGVIVCLGILVMTVAWTGAQVATGDRAAVPTLALGALAVALALATASTLAYPGLEDSRRPTSSSSGQRSTRPRASHWRTQCPADALSDELRRARWRGEAHGAQPRRSSSVVVGRIAARHDRRLRPVRTRVDRESCCRSPGDADLRQQSLVLHRSDLRWPQPDAPARVGVRAAASAETSRTAPGHLLAPVDRRHCHQPLLHLALFDRLCACHRRGTVDPSSRRRTRAGDHRAGPRRCDRERGVTPTDSHPRLAGLRQRAIPSRERRTRARSSRRSRPGSVGGRCHRARAPFARPDRGPGVRLGCLLDGGTRT